MIHGNGRTAYGQRSSCLDWTEMFMLLLYVVSWLVIQLEVMEAPMASLKRILHQNLRLRSDVMRPVKHVSLQALWQPRPDTKQWKWLVPAQPHVQLSTTFSCPAWRKQARLFCHTDIIQISFFFSIWTLNDSLWWFLCAFRWPQFNQSSTLSSRAFNLTLMASDKCSYQLQKCLMLTGCLPIVSYFVYLLFYTFHCHLLLN